MMYMRKHILRGQNLFILLLSSQTSSVSLRMFAPVTGVLAAVFVAVGFFGSEISRGPLGLRLAHPGFGEATAEPELPAVEEEAGARPPCFEPALPPHRAYVRYLATSPGYGLEGILASPLSAWAIPCP